MELKNAVAVCLITLFSATLVVLIARSLDSQAAARLEPQLARIVEELQAIRSGGGLAASPGASRSGESPRDGLVVYYFHGSTRCPTCESIETQAHATLQSDFAPQLESGEVAWKTLNYAESSATDLAAKFDIQMPVVVLARTSSGEITDWKRLDQVWGLVGNRPAFAEFIRQEIRAMLPSRDTSAELAASDASAVRSESDLSARDEPDETSPADLPLPD